jgi:NADPH2:quinone reductase
MRVSGVVQGDTKKRSGTTSKMAFPHIIPHCDGAGIVDAVGANVPASRVGQRVWTFDAQIGRPFGTAAEYCVVPAQRAIPLPDNVDLAQAGTIGISGVTAHRAVFYGGSPRSLTYLVAGGGGRVGVHAVQFARWGGATVIATTGDAGAAERALAAGADHVLNYRTEDVAARVKSLTGGDGVDRIVEVNLGSNIDTDARVLKLHGIITTYASDPDPKLPVWSLIFQNATLHFLGFDDIPEPARQQATADINTCLAAGLLKHAIAGQFPLADIAAAHEMVENRAEGAVLLTL